jgi:hypothetical protein
MTKLPPFLPEETLLRVLRIARLDGLSMALVAGFFALISALFGDGLGAIVGVLVAGAGGIELHGATVLERGEPRGINWLIGSQFVALASIVGYCGMRLWHPALEQMLAAVTDDMKASLETAGWTPDKFVRFVYTTTYYAVAVVTSFYQGGMALYYYRRREPVARALASDV